MKNTENNKKLCNSFLVWQQFRLHALSDSNLNQERFD